MFKKLTIFALCFLVAAGVFSGCTKPQSERAQEGLQEHGVRQQVVAGLGRDAGEMYGYGAHPPLTRVLEPLIFQDMEEGLVPGLAVYWEASGDSLTWTIQLREGVEFHDGNPFNAQAVVDNLWRIAEMSPGRFGVLETIEAVEELVVEVTHSEPFASFPYALAWPGSAMISPAAVAEDGSVIEPVGTGPFSRESWTPGEEMVLVRNDKYWGGPPKLERIILKYIADPTTRMMALEAGEIDMIIDTGGVLPEQVPTLQQHPQIEVLTVAGAVPHYMSLNTREWPLDDLRLRKAVMYAIDPESIIQYVLEGYGRVMTSIIPYSEMEWLHPDELFQFNNPEKARKLLQEAGWQDSGSGVLEKDGRQLQVKFLLASSLVGRFPYQPIAEIVQAQLRDVGIAVSIEVVEAGLWRENLQKGEANISMRPWSAICPQSRLYAWLHSEGENTLSMGIFYNNPQVDALTEKLLRTTDENEARKIAFQIQEIAAEEVPLIPFYDEVLVNAVRTNIKGYRIDPKFNVNWEDIYVDEGN